MSVSLLLSWARGGLFSGLLMLAAFAAVESKAADLTFQVHLIWGTDGERPKDQPSLKDVDPKVLEKIRALFKWKNYFEVSRKPLSVPKGSMQKLKLSDKCEIQVQDQGNSRIEIQLFGEGRLVVKQAQSVSPGETIILGGHGKDDTAWLVVLAPQR